MAKQSLPYFSATLLASNASPPTDSFGYTWEEVVTRVEGFRIEATDNIHAILNIPHHETRKSIEMYDTKDSDFCFFILHPGEYVVKVHICYTTEVVAALQIFTNKRVTPWFGKIQGQRVTFQAEEGWCINAFRGKYGAKGCSQLSVVFAPKAMAAEGHSLVVPYVKSVDEIELENDGWSYERRSIAHDPCAVVVTSGANGIDGVRVVTSAEYDRLVRFPDPLHSVDDHEDWLVLIADEHITSVRVAVEDDRIRTISFETNLQTSCFFGGSSPMSEETILKASTFVCGFELTHSDRDTKSTLTGLNILCAPPARGSTASIAA